MGRLDGKVAFITGTGDGQGRTSALVFAAEGAVVVGCDIAEKADDAAQTVALVEAAGGTMYSTAPVDLGDASAARAWIEDGIARAGSIDVLYNNAVALRFSSIADMTVEDWSYTLRNELDVVFHPVQAAWPHLQRGGGAIINMGSVSGWRGVRAQPQFAHGAAKAGVIGMTRHLAAEGATHGIRVNSISPGLVITPINAALADPDSEMSKVVRQLVPLGRAATTEEISRCAVFLASDDASYVTGADLVVDGGLSNIL
jgi:meso-butanediol dehydrogenase/(S,S)-butanediol dehydrogenase/diacetyl reductase